MLFGVTGDLARKIIVPALYAMAKRGVLNVPVVGVAAAIAGCLRDVIQPHLFQMVALLAIEPLSPRFAVALAAEKIHHRARSYKPGSWGTKEGETLIGNGCGTTGG